MYSHTGRLQYYSHAPVLVRFFLENENGSFSECIINIIHGCDINKITLVIYCQVPFEANIKYNFGYILFETLLLFSMSSYSFGGNSVLLQTVHYYKTPFEKSSVSSHRHVPFLNIMCPLNTKRTSVIRFAGMLFIFRPITFGFGPAK